MDNIAVLGAGSWGTTLAGVLAEKGFIVSLWVRNPELCRSIAENNENEPYLPGVKLPRNLRPTSSLEEALKGSALIVSAIPSHGVREIFAAARGFISEAPLIVSATKGIEEETLLTPSGVIRDVLKGVPFKEVVILSGPSFAKEVSVKLPAAVSAASLDNSSSITVQKTFSTPYFRVYTNRDVVGVELGGALKNVIAISSGICDGLALGNNARAALITRGLAEISRLGVRMGASPLTFSGLSGLGDLILTCTGALSRNYSLGFDIGRGRSLADITRHMRMVAEGVRTSKGAHALASIHKAEMPITEAVYDVLYQGKPAKEAVLDLMMRELKGE